ncbi:CAP domain-containing protein [Spirilliplanes yamanashiensis]|uniref:Ricin B lectin domain-containing protein n=1 Tax=Spirilliplanes yamanashiensis TaxID=42233 RepID=A0A8J3Y9H0_9ACTN|nr:CAP domain-containing protein [Spirilliplanes yamanashiensis]MDP9815413.1 uncharacterized protein YkwD [Spirilliplanes yamanashiensis]GIJ03668.1 hypothetical protein Sya03_30200 [Spirilliplanes yamanashiensis]
MTATPEPRRRVRPRTLAILVCSAVVGALGVLGVTNAMAATAGRITGLAGQCVDVSGARTANGTAIQLYTCNGTGAQNWTVGNSDDSIRALGKCLDVNRSGTADGTLVQLYDCNGTGAQKWTAGEGSLVNPQSGKCLDASGHNSANGTRLIIWTCTGAANQTWTLPGDGTTPPPPPPTTTQPPTQPPVTPPAGDAAVIAEVTRLTNAERAKADPACPALTADPGLQAAAQKHSDLQAVHDKMSHRLPGEADMGDRVTAEGYRWNGLAENVAAGYTSATSVVAGWMGSAGHKANILECDYEDIGVGVAKSSDGTLYWTQVFGSRP